MRRSKLLVIAASALSTSCSLQSPSQTPLHIEIPRSAELSRNALHSRAQSTASNYTTAPSSLADFDCFAVNVTAAEIAPQASQPCTLPSDMIGAAGGWVSANSYATSKSSTNVSIDLMVPSGPDRLIQIYGVRTPDQCPQLGDFKSARLGDIYLIGSVTQDIFDDTDVPIKAQLDTSQKALASCQTSPAINLGTTTYYVLGPSSASVNLPLPNSGQYTLTSVGSNANGISNVTDAGDHAHFSYNPNSTRGIDQFTYTAIDSSGKTGTGNIVIKNVTPTTWTGEYGDHNWSSAGNWCGSVNGSHTACTNTGPVPNTGSTAYFDGTCSAANCSANIAASTAINSLFLDSDYPGIITASASTTLTVSSLLRIDGGTLNFANGTSSLNIGQLIVRGGSLTSYGSGMNLGGNYGINISDGFIDLKAASSASLGDLTISGGTLHAPESGTITYNGAITYTGGTINSGATLGAYAILNNPSSSAVSLHLNSPLNFQNLTLQSAYSSGNYTISGNIHVIGKLLLNGVYSASAPILSSPSGGSGISVEGDLSVNSPMSGYGGTLPILMNGTGNQTITLPGSANLPYVSVSKSGTLAINNSSALTLYSLTATQVENIGAGPLSLPSGQIYAGKFMQNGSGSTSFATSTLNGELDVQTGTCYLNGDLHVTGNLNVSAGATLNKAGHVLTVDLVSSIIGSLIP